MKPSHIHKSRYMLGISLATLALVAMLATVMLAPPASANIGGSFVPVAVADTCTLATGFSTGGTADCGAGIDGQQYIYLPDSGGSLTYSFTLPSGTSHTLTYGIPAGGFVNNVDATVSLDGSAPVTLSSDLGSFDQTTPSDLALWTSPSLGPGTHTWTITSTGDAVNIYGLWLNENVTDLSTSLSGSGQSGSSISVSTNTAVTDAASLTGSNATSATGTVTYNVYSDSNCTIEVGAGSPQAITVPGTLPSSSPVTLTSAGMYYWQASYSGDINNSASLSACGSEVESVAATTGCTLGTTSCTASFTAPTQTLTVTGTKPSSSTASIVVSVATQILSCLHFGYSAPVTTLTDVGLQTGTSVTVIDKVSGLPSKKGVVICYQPIGSSPTPAELLVKCHGSGPAPCYKSVKEVDDSVLVKLVLPAGDPRFHIGGETPGVTGFSPTSAVAGKKLTIKGTNLSEVTKVTIGGLSAPIKKAALSKVTVTVPAGSHGGVVSVISSAGVSTSTAVLTVT